MNDLKIKHDGRFYGVVGKNNAIVVPFIYDEILRTFSSGLINVCKNDKWGCLDLNGTVVVPIEYDWITPFGKDTLSSSNAKKNGKWGTLNRMGEELIPCIYDEEIVFKDNYAIVSLSGKMGIINKDGKCVFPCHFSFLKPFVKSSKLLKSAENNKCGIVDVLGNIIAPTIYEEVGDLYGDLVVVKQNGFYGLINLNGDIVIPLEYEFIDKSHHGINKFDIDIKSEFFSVKKNCKWKYIIANSDYRNNNQYDWVSGPWGDNYNYIVRLKNKYGIVNRLGSIIVKIMYSEIFVDYDYYILKINGQMGICDNTGEFLLPVFCSDVQILSKKSAIVEKDMRFFLFFFNKDKASIEYDEIRRFGGTFCKVTQNGKCGVINDEGGVVIPIIYDYINYKGRKKVEVIKDNKFGIIDLAGNTVLPIKYGVIKKMEGIVETDDKTEKWSAFVGQEKIPPIYGDAMIMQLNGKYGVVNSRGIELIPFKYDMIDFFKGIFIVNSRKKIGVIDINNNRIFPIIYDEIIPQQKEGLLLAKEKKLWGVLSITGNEVIPPKYTKINLVGKKLIVKLDDKYGVIDINNRQIIPTIYDEIIHDHTEDLFLVKDDKHWGILDSNGAEIIPLKYEKMDDCFSCHRLAVSHDSKWGFVNEKGVEVIKCIYDGVLSECFEDNKCFVKQNGEIIEIDIYGIMIK